MCFAAIIEKGKWEGGMKNSIYQALIRAAAKQNFAHLYKLLEKILEKAAVPLQGQRVMKICQRMHENVFSKFKCGPSDRRQATGDINNNEITKQ